MEEIDVLDINGNKTGKIVCRDEVHKKGYWHKSVHIWIINDIGNLILQKKKSTKINIS